MRKKRSIIGVDKNEQASKPIKKKKKKVKCGKIRILVN